MKKLIALMMITGFLAGTAPLAFAENGGSGRQPWYNPPTPQAVPEVPVVSPPATTHAPVEAAGSGAGMSTGMMIGIGVAVVGAVALAAGGGGGGGGSTPTTPTH